MIPRSQVLPLPRRLFLQGFRLHRFLFLFSLSLSKLQQVVASEIKETGIPVSLDALGALFLCVLTMLGGTEIAAILGPVFKSFSSL